MRARAVLAVTAFTTTAVFGGAGLAAAEESQPCVNLEDEYSLPLNKLTGQATGLLHGKEASAGKLFCVNSEEG